jgi:hypothetical protein
MKRRDGDKSGPSISDGIFNVAALRPLIHRWVCYIEEALSALWGGGGGGCRSSAIIDAVELLVSKVRAQLLKTISGSMNKERWRLS